MKSREPLYFPAIEKSKIGKFTSTKLNQDKISNLNRRLN